MDGPEIIPIVDENTGKAKYHHPNLPDVGVGVKGAGECLLMISPRQTGKSTIISSLFLNDNFYGQDFFPGGVIVISPTINMDSTSRFMKKRFECHDTYSPQLIQNIIQRQSAKGDDDPTKEIALVLDDCVGLLDSNIANLVTRSRHFGIKLLVISVQKFRGAVDPIIRSNATSVIVGSPFPNQREILAVSEEFGDLFKGSDNWMKLYKQCCKKKYDFCYMKLSKTAPEMYHNFRKLVAIGGADQSEEEKQNELNKLENISEN